MKNDAGRWVARTGGVWPLVAGGRFALVVWIAVLAVARVGGQNDYTVAPTNHATGVATNAAVVFVFPEPMNPRQSQISFTSLWPPYSLTMVANWSADLRTVTCLAQPALPAKAQVSWLLVGMTATSHAWPGVGDFFTEGFEGFLAVSSLPPSKATEVSRSLPLVFEFSAEMNTNATSVLLTSPVAPYRPVTTNTWALDRTRLTCRPVTPLPAQTRINWTLTAQDVTGRRLPVAAQYGVFTTGSTAGEAGYGTNAVTRLVVGGTTTYAQSSAGLTLADDCPYAFEAAAVLASNRLANAIRLVEPSGAASRLTQDLTAPERFLLRTCFGDLAEYGSRFPSGAYAIQVQTDLGVADYRMVLADAATHPPAPRVSHPDRLQQVDVTQALTLAWEAWTEGTTEDRIVVRWGESDLATLDLESPAVLDGTATGLSLPAGVLVAGTNYTASLTFLRRTWGVANDGTPIGSWRATTTRFPVRTFAGPPLSGASVLLSRGERLRQEGEEAGRLPTSEILALGQTGSAARAMLTPPGSPMGRGLGKRGAAPGVSFQDVATTAEAFQIVYPAGDYELSFETTNGWVGAAIRVREGGLPPVPILADGHASPYALPHQPWRVAWSLGGDGSVVDYFQLQLEQNGRVVFATPLPDSPGALTGSSNAVVVPADIFPEPGSCEVLLTAYHYAETDSGTLPGALLRAGDHRTTILPLPIVNPSAPPPQILTTNLPYLPAGDPILTALRTADGIPPLRFRMISGRLPEGLVLESAGVISGQTATPTETVITAEVSDLLGRAATRAVRLEVVPVESAGPPPTLANTRVAEEATVTFDLLGTPGRDYTLERSTNLVQWMTWLRTNLVGNQGGVRVAIDADRAFYRARLTGGPSPRVRHPNSIEPHPDTNVAATVEWGLLGGTLHFTNRGGYRLTLAVPPGALAHTETIALRELPSVDGLPMSGGLLAAVELQPEGLLLDRPASLEITPPTPVDPDQVIGFGARQDGSQLAFQPVFGTNGTFSLSLWHFCIVGAGRGTAADAAAQTAHPPDSSASATAQDIAALLLGCRQDPNCSLEDIHDPLCAMFRQLADEVVIPRLQAAVADDSLLESAIAGWLAWLHDLGLLSLYNGGLFGETDRDSCTQGRVMRAGNLAAKAIANGLHKACDRCLDHDIAQIGRVLDLARQAGLLSLDFSEYAFNCVRRCLVFEVDLESEFVSSDGKMILSAHTKGHARLAPGIRGQPSSGDEGLWSQLMLQFSGSGDWPITDLQQPAIGKCSWRITPAPGSMVFPFLHLTPYRKRLVDVPGQEPVVRYIFDPDADLFMESDLGLMPKEQRVVVCPMVPPQPAADIFGPMFNAFHNDEVVVPTGFEVDLIGSSPCFRFSGFTGPGPGDVLLSKPYLRTQQGTTENTLIEIHHTPGQ